jgi:hypothetical protein
LTRKRGIEKEIEMENIFKEDRKRIAYLALDFNGKKLHLKVSKVVKIGVH